MTEQEQEEERRRLVYLRHHREQIQQRYRREAERRGEELETDVAAMKARRDDARAAKSKTPSDGRFQATHSLPGIYARFDDLGGDELQMLATRYGGQRPFNTRGKYHARYMKDAYPIAGSQLKLEKEHEMHVAAKKKLLLSDASSLVERSSFGATRKGGGLERTLGPSKLDHFVEKLTTVLNGEQEQVSRSEAERKIRLCAVKHREGMEQFWRLMRTAPIKREVIAWLKFHSFLDVNIPVRLVPNPSTDVVAVCEDRTLGVTPLMAACRSLCVDLVRCLLEHGAVVWLATANGDAAIHFLWRDWALGTTATVREITALMLRTQRVQDILVALIAQGADVNAQNAFGETALQFCARYGLQDCAKLLLLHGADAFIRDRKGKSAVHYAKDNDFKDLHRLLSHYNTVELVRAEEKERRETTALLNRKRGALAATWSKTPEDFFTKLKVEQERSGHLRNQFVDCRGQVIVCTDEDEWQLPSTSTKK
ncbi:hypothetical protein KRP22_003757 [Phytophthora ramorum]|nr:Inversin [Phytophthora ramorum]